MSTSLPLPKQPVVYEINTAVFLSKLSKKYDRIIKLGSVPDEEWKAIADLPVDAVWLMGVWERSPYSRNASKDNPEFRRILPDFSEKDNLGSAYSIRSYEVDKHFGGDEGLAKARETLRRHGLGLILDFVPNHVACDHEWVKRHHDYLIAGDNESFKSSPGRYYKSSQGIFAYGKDPEFPPWTDVLQLNAFSEGLRQAAVKILTKIATQCDGVRCDMAMLLTNQVFQLTWGRRVGNPPKTEYWAEVISSVRKECSEFIFIAEVYWNWERGLLAQGFDYCYDKTLYDYLAEGTSLDLFQYVHADPAYQVHLLRFIENHDEPRASEIFKSAKRQAAAFVLATLPGAVLYHQGQLEGYKIKLPVHLGRGPVEETDVATSHVYQQLMQITAESDMRDGVWRLCRGNNGLLRSTKLIAWLWTNGRVRYLCVVNYNNEKAAGHFALPSPSGQAFTLLLGEDSITQKGVVSRNSWLTLELEPWGYVLFRFVS